ncbi:glycosyltransferase [Streptomyces sp. NPDC093111]|uniref:glycosyltransferase family 4 protein n=1 Tax=Streptomyces sp. NPDC093111 TaxID=3154978 RepID=UPI0034393990
MPTSVETAIQFWPRGGSAQVVRYLHRDFETRSITTRVHAGSRGTPGDPSHAPTFYAGLDLRSYDHQAAHTAFLAGRDPQAGARPHHPSYEDRGHCPDPLYSAVPPAAARRLTSAWKAHLTAQRSTSPAVLHLHHLSHLQLAAHAAFPSVPRVTTLHGTELKHLQAIEQRVSLAEQAGLPLAELARRLHSKGHDRQTHADRIAQSAGLDETAHELLLTTHWEKWTHAEHWAALFRQAAALAGPIVTVSHHDQALARQLLHLPEDPSVIGNGVDTRLFAPRPLTDAQRASYLRRWLVTDAQGWGPGGAAGSIRYTDTDLHHLHNADGTLRPLLLWVGRFLDFKRVPVLLEAFALLRARSKQAPVLLMWGGYPGECEGEHPADIARRLGIDDDVHFIGWRGHDELPLGLNTADLMVAPAVDEPFGMVYLEAMACGTPPIATRTGGPARTILAGGPARTILADGPQATGWLAAPDDPADLAHVLQTALRTTRSPAAHARIADRARNHITSTYSWSRTADAYLDTYDLTTTR